LYSQPPQTSTPAEGTASPAAPSPAPGWIHFVVPSVADLLFVTLLLGLSLGALGRLLLRDADIGWHIRDGQQMLLHHAITRTDSFSSTMNGHTWYAWEWLYDVLIAVIHQVFGLNGVVFYSAAIIAATFVLTLYLALRRGGNLPVTLFLLILSLGAAAVHFLARPHVLSWLFAVIWFELLDSAASGQGRRVFWLPALMVLWVNLHGGFVLGFAMLLLYLVGGAMEYFTAGEKRGETQRWLQRLGLVTLLTLVASFINPYGYYLHVHIYRYLSDRFLMNQISEFLSPDFHSAAQQCFAILFIVTMVTLATARQRPSAARLLIILFAAYSGFYATRNLPTSALLMTLVIAPILSENLAEAGRSSSVALWLRQCLSWLNSFGTRMGNLELRFRGHVWIVLVFVLGLWACAHRGRLGSTQFINAYFDDKRFPVQAAEYMAQHDLREPVFSLDYWGGYLIYRLYPRTKVMVDDRHDLYGDQFFKDYLKVVLVQPEWEQVLDQRQVDWVLVPSESSLANLLRLTPRWKSSYEDKAAVLFHRGKN
jgi:hypothetical protein